MFKILPLVLLVLFGSLVFIGCVFYTIQPQNSIDEFFDIEPFDPDEKSRCTLEPTWDQPWKIRGCLT